MTYSAPASLVTLDEVKEHLRKAPTSANPGSAADDVALTDMARAATFVVHHVTGQTVPAQFSEWLTPNWGVPGPNLGVYGSGYVSVTLARTPILSVDSIAPQFYNAAAINLLGAVIDADAGVVWFPTNQLFLGPCLVTYTVGRAVIPANLHMACLIIVQHLWDTQRGPASPGVLGGGDVITVPGVGYAVPSRAMELMQMSPFHAAPGFA